MSKHRDSEWWKLADEYRDSGMSQKEWCDSKGINLYTFRDRLSKLKKAVVSRKISPDKEDNPVQLKPETVNWLAVEQKPADDDNGTGVSIAVGQVFMKVCRALIAIR